MLISLETDLSCEDLFDLPHCLSLAFYNQISSTPFRILLTTSGQDFQGINQAGFQGLELHFTSFSSCSCSTHAFLSTSNFKSLFKLYKGSKLYLEWVGLEAKIIYSLECWPLVFYCPLKWYFIQRLKPPTPLHHQ